METNETTALLRVITDYTYALDILDKYDHQLLEIASTTSENIFKITYPAAMEAIKGLHEKFGGSALFGNEKDESFQGSLAAIYQTFDGQYLYPSVEEKAANLLYFVIKNHSFSDGNKRIAAFLFVWFLERNGILYNEDGSKRIADNALVAFTLMIAASKPEEKDMMTKVVVNLINFRN
jgi:prophage maintenance system killer protein